MRILKDQKFRFAMFILLLVAITYSSFAQTQIQQGEVSGIWTKANLPYLIQGEITIPADSTLVIEPGVTVEFQGHYKLKVIGRLLAIGAENDSIIFTSQNPDSGWHGVRFEDTPSTNDSSKIIYCKLEYGNAIGTGDDNSGGAIYVSNFSKLRISHCLISNNRASQNGIPEAGGGGIAIAHHASPVVSNNVISANRLFFAHGNVGGGIAIWDNSHPIIKNNLIESNYCYGGGGIFFGINSDPILLNNTIANNDAQHGGGIASWYYSKPLLVNNIIVQNRSFFNGGGLWLAEKSNPILINNHIIFNRASNGNPGSGGGIHCRLDSDPILINTIIWGNNSTMGKQVGLEHKDDNPKFYYCIVEAGLLSLKVKAQVAIM